MAAAAPLNARRTYWHLASKDGAPSEYEIGSSALLYYVGRGFEVSAPLAAWYVEHQTGSRLSARKAEAFADPRATTYASYVALQHAAERRVDALFAAIEASDYDRKLRHTWLNALAAVLPVMRYPVHALQMLACYVGHMAPSGRIAIACAMQAADEIRRIQRLAYRMRQLQEVERTFGNDAAERWQHAPAWQPMRELLERLLITYDWGEALVALNLAVKPALDELFMVRFARAARAAGDDLLAQIFDALYEDCRWHRAWAQALLETLCADDPANAELTDGLEKKWALAARSAIAPLEPLFDAREGEVP